MKRSYMVIYERIAPDNWGGWTPDISGAVGAGDSIELARQSLLEGIHAQLENLAERGIEAPQAVSKNVDFSEFDPDPSEAHYEVEWLSVTLPEIHAHTDTHTAQAA